MYEFMRVLVAVFADLMLARRRASAALPPIE